MLTFLKTAGIIFGLSLIIPLMVWGGSGNWRGALYGWWQWAKIMIGFVVVGGGLGLLVWLTSRL